MPYYAQVASPTWAEAVFDRGEDPTADPRWTEWDARDTQEYTDWVWRACGAVCVKMCAEGLGGPVLPVMEWVRRGLALNGYLYETLPDGSRKEIGWNHGALAQLVTSAGLQAAAQPATLAEICDQLMLGNPVIASVSFELGTEKPITHRGGHLVVVVGADCRAGEPLAFYIHNPSGRTPALRENAKIDPARFSQAYSGRAIIVSNHPLEIAGAIPAPQEQAHAEP